MGKVPEKDVPVAVVKTTTAKPLPLAPPAPKKINCFAMDKPPAPGLIPVSTNQVKDGCFVLTWQPQQVTMLVTEAPQWYSYAGKILKANLIFTAVFACALLIVLISIRDRW